MRPGWKRRCSGSPCYETGRPTPDFASLHRELQSHRHLTLQLLWEEYRQNHPDGYGYRVCVSTPVRCSRSFFGVLAAMDFSSHLGSEVCASLGAARKLAALLGRRQLEVEVSEFNRVVAAITRAIQTA